MISRITGSPFVHRLLAFALALVGGHSIGQALRVTGRGPLLDFGPLYVGSWMIRDGQAWADLYDPVFFSGAVSHVAPAGRILDLGTIPPAVVLLAYPFTGFTADYGKFLFAGAGTLFLLFGLFCLGSGRMLGWNRSEWIALSGIVLGSAAAQESVLRGGAATWVFGIVALAVAAHAVGNRWTAAILSGLAANFGPVGWGPFLFGLWRGSNNLRILSAGVATAGLVVQGLALGSRGISLYAEACLNSWRQPAVFDPSWVARAGRIGASLFERAAEGTASGGALRSVGGAGSFGASVSLGSELGALIGAGLATGLVAALLLLLLRQLRRRPEFWFPREEPSRRTNFDPPSLLGIGPSLLVGLLLLAVPEPFRGQSLLWGLPLWASVTNLESRPGTGRGLLLLLLALVLLLPAPLAVFWGPDGRANLVLFASLGLVLWWWWEFRGDRPGTTLRSFPPRGPKLVDPLHRP